jgi:hypothetical protein
MPDGGIGRMGLAGEPSRAGADLMGPLPDAAPGKWVRERTTGEWFTVGSLMPSGFPAYARIFHPAYRVVADQSEAGDGAAPLITPDGVTRWEAEVPWADVAGANGRRAHPAMEWVSITGSERFLQDLTQPGIWDRGPLEGSLPEDQSRRLIGVLGRHTTTPERCWFGLWEGYGNIEAPPTAGRLEMPNRSMLLFRGPIDAWLAGAADPVSQSPSLWWPEDRTWCVATDVDLMTTYVGATVECIDAVLVAPGLEAAPVTLDQPTTWDQDTVNPPPEPGFE